MGSHDRGEKGVSSMSSDAVGQSVDEVILMAQRFLTVLAVLAIASVSVSTLLADDGIGLSIHKGPPAGSATLTWTGSVPNFDVFRSPVPGTITDPSHLVVVLGARQQLDAALPATGSALYYLVTSVGRCAPLSPAAICGSGERCYPTEDSLTSCAPPVGAGGQCSACATDATCSPIHSCVAVISGGQCMKWCRIGFSSDCTFGSVCLPFAPALFAGSQQYGACYCP
jgi:hypothetical protein